MLSGHSSVVERLVANEKVEGSNPFARSICINMTDLSEKKLGLHSTIFRKRPGTQDIDGNLEFKKIFGKIYLKSKK